MITIKLQAIATDKNGRSQPIEVEVLVNNLYTDTNDRGERYVAGSCSIDSYDDANFEFIPENGFEAF